MQWRCPKCEQGIIGDEYANIVDATSISNEIKKNISQQIAVHIRTCYELSTITIENLPGYCLSCGQTFKNKNGLTAHLRHMENSKDTEKQEQHQYYNPYSSIYEALAILKTGLPSLPTDKNLIIGGVRFEAIPPSPESISVEHYYLSTRPSNYSHQPVCPTCNEHIREETLKRHNNFCRKNIGNYMLCECGEMLSHVGFNRHKCPKNRTGINLKTILSFKNMDHLNYSAEMQRIPSCPLCCTPYTRNVSITYSFNIKHLYTSLATHIKTECREKPADLMAQLGQTVTHPIPSFPSPSSWQPPSALPAVPINDFGGDESSSSSDWPPIAQPLSALPAVPINDFGDDASSSSSDLPPMTSSDSSQCVSCGGYLGIRSPSQHYLCCEKSIANRVLCGCGTILFENGKHHHKCSIEDKVDFPLSAVLLGTVNLERASHIDHCSAPTICPFNSKGSHLIYLCNDNPTLQTICQSIRKHIFECKNKPANLEQQLNKIEQGSYDQAYFCKSVQWSNRPTAHNENGYGEYKADSSSKPPPLTRFDSITSASGVPYDDLHEINRRMSMVSIHPTPRSPQLFGTPDFSKTPLSPGFTRKQLERSLSDISSFSDMSDVRRGSIDLTEEGLFDSFSDPRFITAVQPLAISPPSTSPPLTWGDALVPKTETPTETEQERILRRLRYFDVFCYAINPTSIPGQTDCLAIFKELDRKLCQYEPSFANNQAIPTQTSRPRNHTAHPDHTIYHDRTVQARFELGAQPGEIKMTESMRVQQFSHSNVPNTVLAQAKQYFADLKSGPSLAEVIDLTEVRSHEPGIAGTILPFEQSNPNSLPELVKKLTEPPPSSTLQHHLNFGYRRGFVVFWHYDQSNKVILHVMTYLVDNVHLTNPLEPVVYIIDPQSDPSRIYIAKRPDSTNPITSDTITQLNQSLPSSVSVYPIDAIIAHGYQTNPIGITNTITPHENQQPVPATPIVKTESVEPSSHLISILGEHYRDTIKNTINVLLYWEKHQNHHREDWQKKQLVRAFQESIRNHPQQHTYQEVPGEGNCFFYVVAYQLKCLNQPDELGNPYTHLTLREETIKELLTHSNRYGGFTLDYNQFKTAMTNHDYGLHIAQLIIQALANALGRSIIIISSDGQPDTQITPANVAVSSTIYIGHVIGLHYAALI